MTAPRPGDICTATIGLASRQGEFDTSLTGLLLEACVAICKRCGDECERHAQRYEHCRLCEQACRELLDALK